MSAPGYSTVASALTASAVRTVDSMLKTLRDDPPSSTEALVAGYREAANACKLPDDLYAYIYANYAMIVPAHGMPGDVSLRAAHACWEELRPVMCGSAVMHFTAEGQFYEEATRVATNCIAWTEGHRTEDAAELTRLIDVLDVGCRYARPCDTYIVDTKVRLLLRAGRTEEAFLVVLTNSHNHELDDVRREARYLQWREDYLARNPIVFTDHEKAVLRATTDVYTHMLSLLPDRRTRAGVSTGVRAPLPAIEPLPEGESHPLKETAEYACVFAVVRGDVRLEGDVYTSDWMDAMLDCGENCNGLIIDGNLIIDGDFIDDNGFELIVNGCFMCDYCLTEQGRLAVHGDAELTYGMWGEYNDGDVYISGVLRAPYVFNNDHAMDIRGDDPRKQVYVGGRGSHVSVGAFVEEGCPQHMFNPCVIKDNEESPRPGLFMDCVRRQMNPFASV